MNREIFIKNTNKQPGSTATKDINLMKRPVIANPYGFISVNAVEWASTLDPSGILSQILQLNGTSLHVKQHVILYPLCEVVKIRFCRILYL